MGFAKSAQPGMRINRVAPTYRPAAGRIPALQGLRWVSQKALNHNLPRIWRGVGDQGLQLLPTEWLAVPGVDCLDGEGLQALKAGVACRLIVHHRVEPGFSGGVGEQVATE